MNKIKDIYNYKAFKLGENSGKFVLNKCVIGIEVEVENIFNTELFEPHQRDTPKTIDGCWSPVSDGSLRNGGAEFVSGILHGKNIEFSLLLLKDYLEREEPKHSFSHRCSVHIHMDVSDLTLEQLKKLVEIYCIFELFLFKISGGRLNNEYCIPIYQSKEAIYTLGKLLSSPFQVFDRRLRGNFVKYMALNLLPISKQGSIEFRHLHGTMNIKEITNWINTLFCIKKAAMVDNETPVAPYLNMSIYGPMNYMSHIFGEYSLDYREAEKDIWGGCRTAQALSNVLKLCKSNNSYSPYNCITHLATRLKIELPDYMDELYIMDFMRNEDTGHLIEDEAAADQRYINALNQGQQQRADRPREDAPDWGGQAVGINRGNYPQYVILDNVDIRR